MCAVANRAVDLYRDELENSLIVSKFSQISTECSLIIQLALSSKELSLTLARVI